MGPSTSCGLTMDKRWCVKCVALLVCLVFSSVDETVGQKYEGDSCVTVRGQRGTCRELHTCTTLTGPPSIDDTCGFERNTAIICCAHAYTNEQSPRREEVQQPSPYENPDEIHELPQYQRPSRQGGSVSEASTSDPWLWGWAQPPTDDGSGY